MAGFSEDGTVLRSPARPVAAAPARGTYDDLPVRLHGRCLAEGFEEAACLLAAIRGRVGRVVARGLRLAEGARVVIYLDLVGRVEGPVAWAEDGGFGLHIAAPPTKWLRLAQQFELLARMPRSDIDDLRGFRRVASESPATTVTKPCGAVFDGTIQNLSRSGAAVLVAAALEIGDLVRLGSTRARVARHINGGVAVQFLRLLPLESFGPSFSP